MNTDAVVIINDDKEKDSDIELVDISKEDSTVLKSSNNDAIVIVDDNTPNDNDVIEIIEIDRESNDKFIKEYLNKVCYEDRIVGDFIEKCLDLENSTGMLRVIHRTFLPLYFKMDDYKDSDDFKKLLDMTMRALDVNPNRKFSHLKSVCEIMKSFDKDRKKVNFTTLTTEVRAKPCPRRKRRRKHHKSEVKDSVYKKAKRKPDVIILDDLEDSPTINSDTINRDTINRDTIINNGTINEDGIHKDAISNRNSSSEADHIVILEDDDVPNNSNKENHNQSQDPNLGSNTYVHFLVPQKSEEYNMIGRNSLRIQTIEKQIESFKKRIDELEQQEVDDDSQSSPYIKCEVLKGTIVKLYEELCTLTGCEAVKKREVRFTAKEGRSQLPVKMLEELINENIGSDGNPPFPDFVDVVKCVAKASVEGRLWWSQHRIMAEARSLFTYCGKALQEYRKKREWRYLLGRIDSNLDDDPAESDPVLMERLESNRKIAIKKESDLLESYVQMEQNSYPQITPFRVEQGSSDDEDIDNDEELVPRNNNEEIRSNNNSNISNQRETNNEQSRIETNMKVYGSHKSSNDEVHENVNKSIEHEMLQYENNIECESVNTNNQNTKLIGNDSIADTNNENGLAPSLEGRSNEEVSIKSEPTNFDFTGNDKNDDSTDIGTIVIKDVYSIANTQEFGTTEKSVVTSSNATEKVKEVYDRSNQEKANESCENIGLKKAIKEEENDSSNQDKTNESCENIGVNNATLEINEVLSNDLNSGKLDDTNDNLIQAVKIESSSVLKDMEMFGDMDMEITATIFDIEDPFVVIEISDSSDDSDCELES